MKKQKTIVLVCIFFSMVLVQLIWVSSLCAESRKSQVEVYVKGKKFSSLHEYRLSVLREKIIQSIPIDREDRLEGFLKNLSSILSLENTQKFSEKDLKSVFKSIHVEMTDGDLQVPDRSEVEVMEQMIDSYKKKNNKTGSYVIDPHKVKTININSSSQKKR